MRDIVHGGDVAVHLLQEDNAGERGDALHRRKTPLAEWQGLESDGCACEFHDAMVREIRLRATLWPARRCPCYPCAVGVAVSSESGSAEAEACGRLLHVDVRL